MKVWFLSDLHVDVCDVVRLPDTPPECDVVVLAGDLCEKLSKKALPLFHEMFSPTGAELVYVPGNHCFWKTSLDKEVERGHDVARELGVHLLAEGEHVVFGDVRFVGATLWTDYRLTGNPVTASEAGRSRMNDFKRVRAGNGSQRLFPNRLQQAHLKSLNAIKDVLDTPFEGKTCVVTHHAPHPFSLHHFGVNPDVDTYRENSHLMNDLDASYASDLSEMMFSDNAPCLWLHGHVHQNKDYVMGNTRVVANPHGYSEVLGYKSHRRVSHENDDFVPNLVLEL